MNRHYDRDLGTASARQRAVSGRVQAGREPLLHPAAARGDYLADEAGLMRPGAGPAPAPGFDSRYAREDSEMMRANPGVAPAPGFRSDALPLYQRDGRDVGAGYLNNPFDEGGRQRIGEQFWQAPLGGHVRRALTGQELFGNRFTDEQALITERTLAGLAAVGVGVPTFLHAVNQLTTPQSAETIPM